MQKKLKILAKICFYHSTGEELFDDKDGLAANISVRLRLLVAYLRLADVLHVDHSIEPGDDSKITKASNTAEAKLAWIKSRLISAIALFFACKLIKI